MAEDQEMEQPCKDDHDLPHKRCPSKTYRSTDHSQTLLRGLVSLRDSKILFDVVLRLEGKNIEAHRILLAASCDYFRGMFAGGLKEMEQQEVDIHGISYASMCNILNFIYTSELELTLTNVQETLAAACQLQVYAHAGAPLDGKVYISCGKRGDDYLEETHCYDPECDKWERLADSPVRRAWHGMVAAMGKLYVIGGSNNVATAFRKDVYEVDCYSPQTGQWTLMPSMPEGHGEPGIAVLGSKIYVLGGRSHDSRDRMDYVDIFDLEKNFWDDGPPLEDGISGMAACVLTLPRAIVMRQEESTPASGRYMETTQMRQNIEFANLLVSHWEDLDFSSED